METLIALLTLCAGNPHSYEDTLVASLSKDFEQPDESPVIWEA